jgi:hypothetical protein
MSAFELFDNNLGMNCSEQIWAEYWLSESIPVMQAFADADWKQLSTCWQSRSLIWQSRCAALLEFAAIEPAMLLLMQFLEFGSPPVVIRSAATIRSFGRSDVFVKPELISRLTQMEKESTSSIDRMMISNFLRIAHS